MNRTFAGPDGWRVFLSFAALLLSVALFRLYPRSVKPGPRFDHLGEAIDCTERFPLNKGQAEVLEYGLQDVRGLATERHPDDPDGKQDRIFLVEANRGVLVYSVADGALSTAGKLSLCPKQPCDTMDQRGAVFTTGRLYLAEHGRDGISFRLPPFEEVRESPLPGAVDSLSGPVGLAAAGKTLFITDDRPRSGPATSPVTYDHDYVKWLSEGRPKLVGSVYTCSVENCQPEQIGSTLGAPSGIAAAGAEGPVYVAEAEANEVRWPIYKISAGKWTQSGALGSAKASGPVSPFLGMALDDSRTLVFAAGPGGLYVFHIDGAMLGRVAFDEPVTGVACSKETVYLVVGHMLCRMTITPPRLGRAQNPGNQPPSGPIPPPMPPEVPPPSPQQPPLQQPPPQQPPPQQPPPQQPPPQQPPPDDINDVTRHLKRLVELFDFNQSVIDVRFRGEVQPDAELIRRRLSEYPSLMVLIEGRADERGTREYNYTLGMQRANAVAGMLASLGIPRSRLSVVSYGKDRPLCTEPTEACYQMNRRVDVSVAVPQQN
jgi:peptidoglycan-associated lipoprotein